MLAVGGYLLHELSDQSLRMATGFSGGLGDTMEELCGALTGGVMVIGALFGRVNLDEDHQPAIRIAEQYRSRFLSHFGHTQCAQLRETVVGQPDGLPSCALLVESAAKTLLTLLSEAT